MKCIVALTVSICWPDDCLGVTQSTLSAEMSDAQLQLASSVELKPIIKAGRYTVQNIWAIRCAILISKPIQ